MQMGTQKLTTMRIINLNAKNKKYTTTTNKTPDPNAIDEYKAGYADGYDQAYNEAFKNG